MDVIELIPRLHFLRFPVGHVYVREDDDGLTLIDSGIAGSGSEIAGAIRRIGHATEDVRRLVLTHFHGDHAGGAAEIAAWGEVEVCAHRAEAPVIRGEKAGPQPDLLDWERPVYARVTPGVPEAPPVRVDRELDDGDVLGGGARAVAVPGHTPGSLALLLPEAGVLVTGDAVARTDEGRVILGVFNADRARAATSLERLAALDADVACFGHGEPLVGGAGPELRAAAGRATGNR